MSRALSLSLVGPLAGFAAAAALVALFATGADGRPVPGGDLGVLPGGEYVCELPGDAADLGTAGGRHQPEYDFTVIGDSSYRVGEAHGVYLLTGERVVMTSGPFIGREFRRVSGGFLRLEGGDGEFAALRCVHRSQAPDIVRDKAAQSGQCRTDDAAPPLAAAGRGDMPDC